MSQFYQRYIPPTKPITTESSNGAGKRKRDSNTAGSNGHPQKEGGKTKTSEQDETQVKVKNRQPVSSQTGRQLATGDDVLDKYRISKFAKQQDSNVDMKIRSRQSKKKKKKQDEEEDTQDKIEAPSLGEKAATTKDLSDEADGDNVKHAKLLSKLDRSIKWSEKHGVATKDVQNEVEAQEHEIHDLVPIPQPEQVEDSQTLPTFSTLPEWQARAINVIPSSKTKLENLGLSRDVLGNLKSHGFQDAFPIQATVIPLLLKYRKSVAGDLCISAATGSGKTLAYVAPIVEDLRAGRREGLRAVIVVPTRELVKQVRETCEMCTSGSNIRIATTLGSTSLQAEKEGLVEEKEVYDPVEYQREMNAPIDWSTFSVERSLRRAQEKDLISLTNYVTRIRLKPNILITTPGRLVDHLRNTDGFHLDDVEWFVVDEADRLLNESYQEWIDVVVPALESRRAFKEQDDILLYMRMEPRARVVRKILLSATMTQDISKLKPLGLVNPKPIVMKSTYNNLQQSEGGEDPEPADQTGSNKYGLPPTLQEAAVSLKEGDDKPLQLLDLLRHQVEISGLNGGDVEMIDPMDETSSDESSDGTSSSGSHMDSDSDSDLSSDSSTDSMASSTSNEDASETSGENRQRRSVSSPDRIHSSVRALVFTRSTASASRLSRLLSILVPSFAPQIATLTRSTASSASSRKALALFKSGKVTVLIATDRASRGIDVPGLEHVINYDIPGSALTYVHRAGRTARAGNVGHVWTLVEHREGRWFWNEIGGKKADGIIVRGGKIRKIEVEDAPDEGTKARYETALQTLGAEVRGE